MFTVCVINATISSPVIPEDFLGWDLFVDCAGGKNLSKARTCNISCAFCIFHILWPKLQRKVEPVSTFGKAQKPQS